MTTNDGIDTRCGRLAAQHFGFMVYRTCVRMSRLRLRGTACHVCVI